MSHDWRYGKSDFCGEGGHPWTGCCCPCLLMNKTHVLFKNAKELEAYRRHPQDFEKGHEPRVEEEKGCGLVCCGWCVLNMCGGWGQIIAFIQRRGIRKQYSIKGGLCGDVCVSLCCPCCGLIQQYKEVKEHHQEEVRQYQSHQPMSAVRR